MKYALILGAAASTLALSASAQPTPPTPPAAPHVMIMHHGPELNVDANHDGWISRAEASDAANRMFDELDVNHDGRLTPADRPVWHDADDHVMAIPEDGNCQTSTTDQGQGERRVTVICHNDGPGQHAGMPAPDDPNCQTHSEDQGHGQRRVTVICRDEDEHADAGDRQVERRVVITRSDGGTPAPQAEQGERREEREVIIREAGDVMELPEPPEAPVAPGTPVAPRPPHPPHAPMLMMLFANAEEADTNHDGALSRDEFRAQQLRFFDASDANHDGRIHFEPPIPPEPPAPPAPPEPPTPPAPPHR